jgi:chromatin structure-remodeling complex protein RSC7
MYDVHTNVIQYPKTMQPTHAKWVQINDNAVEANGKLSNGHTNDHIDEVPSMFTPVIPIYSRNYLIVDTVYETPSYSNLGVPGPDGDFHDLGFNGLSSVSEDVRAELSPECLAAFEEALTKEMEWKSKWTTEGTDAHRKAPIIDKGLIM